MISQLMCIDPLHIQNAENKKVLISGEITEIT